MNFERKLMQIYDCLENDQYKQALTQIDLLLKKNNNPFLQSLKAIALSKNKQTQKALDLADSVKKENPKDLSTIQNLAMVYRSTGQGKKVLELYESAYPYQQYDEEFGKRYFDALIREKDFKGMQSLAIKLNRSFKKDQYWFWAIMGLILQAEEIKKKDEELAKKDISYQLAERYLQKAEQDNKIKSYEEFYLKYLVFIGQQNLEKALEWLESDLASTKSIKDRLRFILLPIYQKLNKHDQIIDYCKKNLIKSFDDWFYWLHYLDAIEAKYITPLKEQNIESDLINNSNIKQEAKFIEESIIESQSLNSYKRGPFLAKIHFNKILGADLFELITSYLDKFGDKECAYEDINPYIESELLKNQNEWIEYIDNKIIEIKIDDSNKLINIQNTQRLVNLFKIQKLVQSINYKDLNNINIEKHNKVIESLLKYYIQALPLGKDLKTTEKQYADDFILLASHYLLEVYKVNKDINYLYFIVDILEFGIAESPHNFHLKCLAIRIYNLMGIFRRTLDLYNSLDIKHIQLDTLSHLILDCGNVMGHMIQTRSCAKKSKSIYYSNRTETLEMLVRAFKNGVFSKVNEFLAFQQRVENSLQRGLTDFELIRGEFIECFYNYKEVEHYINSIPMDIFKLDYDNLVDNRDFDIFLDFNSKNSQNNSIDNLSQLVPKHNKLTLQFHIFPLMILKLILKDQFKSKDFLHQHINNYTTLMNELKNSNHITEAEKKLAIIPLHLLNTLNLIYYDGGDSIQSISNSINQCFKETRDIILSYLNTMELGLVLINLFYYLEKFAVIWTFSKILINVKAKSINDIKLKIDEILTTLDIEVINFNLSKLKEIIKLVDSKKKDFIQNPIIGKNIYDRMKFFVEFQKCRDPNYKVTTFLKVLDIDFSDAIKQLQWTLTLEKN